MRNNLLQRNECQQLVRRSTTKIYSSSGGFIGTGFFLLPNILVSCYHVFFGQNSAIQNFKIEGSDLLIPLRDEAISHVDGLDLICIDVENELDRACIPLGKVQSQISDKLWGYTFNIDYVDGAPIRSKLIEEAIHNGRSVYRVEDDIIKEGSSGTPLWNITQNTFLGVVYWLKEHKRDALVIPAIYFREFFPDLFQQNLAYHKDNTTWREAIEKDQQSITQSPVKRKAKSEYFEIYAHQYVGRVEPKNTLRDFLTSSNNFLFIYGIGGIGKSHLVKSVVEELKMPFIYIRLTPSSNTKSLAYQLGVENVLLENKGWIHQELIDAIQEIEECIIIDDFYEIEDDINLQNTLLQLATLNKGKVVLISRVLPELYIAASTTLPKLQIQYLGREEHLRFVEEFSRFKSIGNRRLKPFEQSLWEISNGHPLISQIIINYSDDDIYDDFDVDSLETWDFEADKEGKHFISRLLDTVLRKGKPSEKEFLLNFSLMLGEVPSKLLKELPAFNRDNLKSLIRRKHFIQTLTKKDNKKAYNLHPLVRELLRKKAGDRPYVHLIAAECFHEMAQTTEYDNMIAFNNALYHYQNSDSEKYEQFIKSTNAVFIGGSIKKLINDNIDSSIARLIERQRRKPLDLAVYNELSRLYLLRGQEVGCFKILNMGLAIDSSNEILLFGKAYAFKHFSKEKEAEVIFEELANLDNTYAIFQLCQAEYQNKNWLSCIRLCDWISWLEPENRQALQYRGMVLYQWNRYKEALVEFDKILKLDPENIPTLQYRGMVLYQWNWYKEALVEFDKILKLDSENIPTLQYRGMVLYQRNWYKEALVEFDKILKLDPENIQALQYRGMVLYQRNRYEEALIEFDKILKLNPENIQALQYKGMVLYQWNRYEEALVEFDKILKLDPENRQALLYRGMVLFQWRWYEEALIEFDRLLKLDPKHIPTLHHRGMILYQWRWYEEALIEFDKILKLDPEDIPTLQYRGMVLYQWNRYREALIEFNKILKLDPEKIQTLLYKGKSLMKLKNTNGAERILWNANDLDPRNAFIKTELATALRRNGKAEAAIEVYEEAIQIMPRNKPSYNGLYETYKSVLNDYENAVRVVDRLLGLKLYDFRLLKDGIYLLIHRNYEIYDYEKAKKYLEALKKSNSNSKKVREIAATLEHKIEVYSKNNN